MKKFMTEFKEFAMRGNMIDLAVGIIIGGAFTTIVNSLVNDVINPVLGLVIGRIDFSSLFITLDGKSYASLKAAEEAGAAVLKYGSFVSNMINFVIMAFVVFLFVKAISKLTPKSETTNEVTTKICPYCKSEIAIDAIKCPHCTSELTE